MLSLGTPFAAHERVACVPHTSRAMWLCRVLLCVPACSHSRWRSQWVVPTPAPLAATCTGLGCDRRSAARAWAGLAVPWPASTPEQLRRHTHRLRSAVQLKRVLRSSHVVSNCGGRPTRSDWGRAQFGSAVWHLPQGARFAAPRAPGDTSSDLFAAPLAASLAFASQAFLSVCLVSAPWQSGAKRILLPLQAQ